MTEEPTEAVPPSLRELRDACQTLSGMPASNPDLAAKLQYVASLFADAGPLPSSPALLWRESNQTVRHAVIHGTLLVGRAPEPAGLAFPDDQLLSRNHFSVCVTEEGCLLRNLNSKNGTAVNRAGETVSKRLLLDGDLIFAGNHILAFIGQA
jgi:Inner membrane component of T3SS, cytoplasmic domain